ncbi:MAG: hypothetical protein JEZ02_16995 [Desulfatibacillum sp.]|nr:hypothetical protein [Desulfatibacillum sp.]
MGDPKVGKWSQRGHVYIWNYKEEKKNFPGFHITADKDEGESLSKLLNLMKNAKWPSFADLKISQPSLDILRVPNALGGHAKILSLDSLRIKYPKGDVQPDHWSLTNSMRSGLLVLGKNKISQLEKGIHDVLASKGDYAIGPDSDEQREMLLWFWWRL